MHDDWHHIAAGYCNHSHPLCAEAMEEVSNGNDTKMWTQFHIFHCLLECPFVVEIVSSLNYKFYFVLLLNA